VYAALVSRQAAGKITSIGGRAAPRHGLRHVQTTIILKWFQQLIDIMQRAVGGVETAIHRTYIAGHKINYYEECTETNQ
jgi:hypothetical protein